MKLNLNPPVLSEITANPENFTFLRKIGVENYQFIEPVGDERYVGIIDLETTGFDASSEEIIEIGITIASYSPSLKQLVAIVDNYQCFEEPSKPIPADAVKVNGITDGMVQGHHIDDQRVKRMLQACDFVLAHNAKFDRRFFDKRFPDMTNLGWCCSIADIDWYDKGYSSRSLEYLCMKSGFTYEAHRACSDTVATTVLLATDPSYFAALITASLMEWQLIIANNSPYAVKDQLSKADYDWETDERVWYKLVTKSERNQELEFLEATYANGATEAIVRVIDASTRFKPLF
ncbi:hypothetical protein J4N45_10880 [Vibrio sp. SCSIO 43140]|uniref:3'-5' exonuclease n=1 Tax=Vibrio sp. SCSIO 43140 TaxID=2819100 RepID=UPI0020755623|nr:3'-5' exonuclease [Vibrio sp. SCSIO 43140]USD59034.1 hypothetical protein J4N45_10880 [Vibrio sp. SCSIO 43140]